jgi:dihydropteroate synthase
MSPSDSHPAARWKLRTRTLDFGPMPRLMGIVNVTPDSFSDGGKFLDPKAAVELGLQLVAEGADLLDIGGESARPGAEPVEVNEELRRVMPVVETLCRASGVPVSIDTSKAAVAREALRAGVEIVNDITALTADPAMLPLIAETGCGICVMHIQGTPQTMQQAPVYADVTAEVLDYLRGRRDVLLAAGIDQERIAVDPGIGFGKTLEHNLQLLIHADRFHALGCPALVGPSRKRFIAELAPHLPSPANRLGGTIGAALSLARRGVQVLRVHDVADVAQALSVFQAAGGFF